MSTKPHTAPSWTVGGVAAKKESERGVRSGVRRGSSLRRFERSGVTGGVERLDARRGEAEEEEEALAEDGPRERAQVPRDLHDDGRQVRHALARVVVRVHHVEGSPHDALRRLDLEEARVDRKHEEPQVGRIFGDLAPPLQHEPHVEVSGLDELDEAEPVVLAGDAVKVGHGSAQARRRRLFVDGRHAERIHV
eukprot:2055776-Prymnesium_polylepis.1